MLNAFAAAASAFHDALPHQESLKDSIRKKLEGEIRIEDTIQCENDLLVVVNSDKSGKTTIEDVHADRVKLCKEKQAGDALDQIDLSYSFIFPIVVVLIICAISFGFCLAKLLDVVCSIPRSDREAERAVLTCAFPLTVIFVVVLYFSERDERYKAYEKALRECIILDRIALSKKEYSFTPNDAYVARSKALQESIPEQVIEIWKRTIISNLNNGKCRIDEGYITDLISKEMKVNAREVRALGYLDFTNILYANGWKVEYVNVSEHCKTPPYFYLCEKN